MLSEGHVFICVRHQFPNEPLRFLSPLVLHRRSLFPAITLLLLMSWVGSPPVMPHAFKAQSGSAPAWGKRMGGWKLEKKCCDNRRKRESAKERVAISDHRKTQGSPLCWHCGFGSVLLDTSRERDRGCLYSLCVCMFLCQNHWAAFKELSVTLMDRRDEKDISVSAFSMYCKSFSAAI